jgi:GDP-4-dehydro-6-deoxy-D-mannose reductase
LATTASIKHVIVLGSRGFLGRNLVTTLHGLDADVVGLDLHDFADPDALDRRLRRALEGRPGVVFHAAGCVGPASRTELEAAHVESTERLLRATAETSPDTRIVVVGSAAEIGVPTVSSSHAPEREGGQPTSDYGHSKLAQSTLARELSGSLGLDVIRVRLFNTLGPGQRPNLVAGAMIKGLAEARRAKRKSIQIVDGASVRDFLDVRDVARCLVGLATRLRADPERPPVNVCSGEGLSIAGLAGELLAATGIEIALRFEDGPSPPTRVVGACATLQALELPAPIRAISTLESLRDMWIIGTREERVVHEA